MPPSEPKLAYMLMLFILHQTDSTVCTEDYNMGKWTTVNKNGDRKNLFQYIGQLCC